MNYLPSLNGLRAFSILVILLFHAGVPVMQGGAIGVDVFFVLSGFLITALLLKEYDDFNQISLKKFYVRRALRLFPALFFLLLVVCACGYLFASPEQAQQNYMGSLIVALYLSNWVCAFSLHPLEFLAHTWSLSVEEQFYLIWPISLIGLLAFVKNRTRLFVSVVFLALLSWSLTFVMLCLGASTERLYHGFDTRCAAILVGCALAVLLSDKLDFDFKSFVEQQKNLISGLAMVSAVFLLVLVNQGVWSSNFFYFIEFIAVQLMTALLLLEMSVHQNGILSRVLSVKYLVWLGMLSYSLYLWHFPIFRLLQIHKFTVWGVMLVGMPLTFMMAIFSFYVIERPMLRRKRLFVSQ